MRSFLEQRRLVCNRCGKIISDCEPASGAGEFFHQKREGVVCLNDEKTFWLNVATQLPETPKEVSLFERKRVRRAEKRLRKQLRR